MAPDANNDSAATAPAKTFILELRIR